MELIVAFLVAATFVTDLSAITLQNNTEPDGWFVPTFDGKFFWMSREQFKKESINQPNERKAFSLKYFLYTNDNPRTPQQLFLNDTVSLAGSNFNKSNPTRFLFHGWMTGDDSYFSVKMRRALLKVGNFNVINVDWREVSQLSYHQSKGSISIVGKNVASFIDFLNETADMSFESLSLIGLSLGAHICGFVGKNVKRGRIGVITGLDPSLPLFDYLHCNTRLCSTDAIFVESIQTSAKIMGFLEPIGKATYYPNGGMSQPGCLIDVGGVCSHLRSFLYYVEALLKNNFVAIKCSNYTAAVSKSCEGSLSNENMGSPGSHSNEGCYYVPVNSSPLYGTG